MLLLVSSVCPLMDEAEACVSFPMEGLAVGKTALVGRALPSKALIQLSEPQLFGLRQHSPEVYSLYGRVNGEPQGGLHQGGPSSPPVPVASPW